MASKFVQKRWFYKHLFSYLLLLGVTLAIINGFFGRKINATYQAEVFGRLESDVVLLRDALDDEIRQLTTTANQFQLLDSSSQYLFEDNPLGANNIKAILAMFTLTNTLIDDIVYIPANQQYLFTSSTTSRIDFFVRELFVAKHLDPLAFMNEIMHISHIKAFAVRWHNKEAGLAIAVPLITDYATISGSFLFYLSEVTLASMVKPYLVPYSATLAIEDDTGRLLFGSQSLIDDDKIFDYSLHSTMIPWKISIAIFKEQALLDELNRLSHLQQTSSAIAALVVSLLIFFLMFINYTPIRRLQQIAGSMLETPITSPKQGELEDIAHTLFILKNQNLSLSEKVERARHSEQNLALQRLLSGKYEHINQFNKEGAELSLSLQRPLFVVASINFTDTDIDIEELAELVTDELANSLDSHYVFTPIPDCISFINSIDENQVASLALLYENMRKVVQARTGMILTVGIGTPYQDSRKIVYSFLESRTALDYRFVKGKDNTIVYEEVLKQTSFSTPYPKPLLDQLALALKSADHGRIDENTDQLILFLRQENIPLFFARSISLDTIRLFIEHLPPSLQSSEDQQKEVFLLSDIDTIDEVIQRIRSVKDTFITCEKPRQAELDEEKMLNILNYVKVHCYEYDFSMEQVANYFSLHLPTLSMKFKEYAKINFLDYVTALRMEYAKNLLQHTDLPLKDISVRVGYYNLSSFIRRFKQIHSITPGDYRKIHQDQ